MFREFVDKKINFETDLFKDKKKFSKDEINQSEISDFTKNYLTYYFTEGFNAEEISAMISKANKLYFNYALRPKWTLVNFLFNNFESRSPAEILKKLKLFPFYKYYTEAISDFINDNSMIFITKAEIENIIDRTNQAIHNKLTVDITGQKIKNVFLQLFILNDFNEERYNLEAVIPFSFIKIFLSDKNYPDILSKFDVLNGKNDEDKIELKDIIKVMTGKYSEPEKAESEESVPVTENQGSDIKKSNISDEDSQKIPSKEISEETSKKNLKETTKDSSEGMNSAGSEFKSKITLSKKTTDPDSEKNADKSDFKIKEVKKNPEIVEKKKHSENDNNFSEGFVIKEKIESPDLNSAESDNEYEEESSIEESVASISKQKGIPLDKKSLDSSSDTKKSGKELVKQKNIDFKELFSEKELDSILNRVYNSNLMARQRSFEKLNTYKTWFEAFNHLKEIFKNNKVDIYHKDVIRYVDALNEHFQNKE